MSEAIQILSIQVGQPQTFTPDNDPGTQHGSKPDRPWTSGIIKRTIADPVMVNQTYLDGDGQADLVNHGGIDKAVLAYPNENYALWREEFPSVDWLSGSFGENLTLNGAFEDDVCIGDVHRCGDCVLQVSQPRQPCWKLSKRWKLPKLAVRVLQTRRTGWYYRVLQEGEIEPGQTVQLGERPFPNWTILAANEVMYGKPADTDALKELAGCPLLSESWRETLTRRVNRKDAEAAPEQPE